MNRRIVLVVGVCLALLVAGAWWMWRSGSTARELNAVLAAYEKASGAGDSAGVLTLTAARSIEEVRAEIRAALSDKESELRSRSLFQMVSILSLRARYSAARLAKLSPEEEIRHIYGKPDPSARGPMTVSDVSVLGTRVTCSLGFDSGQGTRLSLGTGPFFERVGEGWTFDWHLMQEQVMASVSGFLDGPGKAKIVEESVQSEFPGINIRELWRGPRP